MSRPRWVNFHPFTLFHQKFQFLKDYLPRTRTFASRLSNILLTLRATHCVGFFTLVLLLWLFHSRRTIRNKLQRPHRNQICKTTGLICPGPEPCHFCPAVVSQSAKLPQSEDEESRHRLLEFTVYFHDALRKINIQQSKIFISRIKNFTSYPTL